MVWVTKEEFDKKVAQVARDLSEKGMLNISSGYSPDIGGLYWQEVTLEQRLANIEKVLGITYRYKEKLPQEEGAELLVKGKKYGG